MHLLIYIFYSYKCIAKNKNGQREHIFDVKMTENSAPIITDAPQSRIAQPGEHITFMCKASGMPQPQITWSFNGFLLNDDDKHITVRQYESEYIKK